MIKNHLLSNPPTMKILWQVVAVWNRQKVFQSLNCGNLDTYLKKSNNINI